MSFLFSSRGMQHIKKDTSPGRVKMISTALKPEQNKKLAVTELL